MTTGQEVSGMGSNTTVSEFGDHVVFTTYLLERPQPIEGLLAVEACVHVRLAYDKPLKKVWPVFKDWNAWQGRYGYSYTTNPADAEKSIVYLRSTSGTNFGTDIAYVIRRVVPAHLIYLESLPHPLANNKGFWNGHNVIDLIEENGQTIITFYMEHTFFSQELALDELEETASDLMFEKGGIAFWKEYFIPDLDALLADI